MTRRVVLLAACVMLVPAAMAGAQTRQYRARLSPVPLDIAMQATIAGLGSATAVLKGSTLAINGTFSG